MSINVKQCPDCKKYNTRHSILGAIGHRAKTEFWLAAYCPDCWHSWYIVYTPDRIEDREIIK